MIDRPDDEPEVLIPAPAGMPMAALPPVGDRRERSRSIAPGSSPAAFRSASPDPSQAGGIDTAIGARRTPTAADAAVAATEVAPRQASPGRGQTESPAPLSLSDRGGAPARPPASRARTASAASGLAATALAFVLALSVYLINGAPLFYRDTGAYLDQGRSMVEAIGLVPARPPAAAAESQATGSGPGIALAPAPSPELSPEPAPAPDDTVDASRSAVYGLALALLDAALPIDLAVLANLALIWAATVLVARRFAVPGELPAAFLSAVALAAASLGALPFYVASLMPDILAPVLLLMVALLCAFWPRLTRGERALAAALAVLAIISHPSHLLTAAILLPVGIFASPGLKGRRFAVAAGLVILLIGAGVLERVAFVTAVERLEARHTRVLPFLTARLIADGPGLDYLERRCPHPAPDPALETCALLGALSRSDAPARLLSANILFSRNPETASFRLLDESQQTAISAEQLGFARRVFAADPIGVLGAFGGNILTQLGYVRVDMTLPLWGQREAMQKDYGAAVDSLRDGRLIGQDRTWLEPLAVAHVAVYILSAGVLVVLTLFPAGLPAETRTFLLLVFAGLVVHAAVCGGISVPAHRYGARVAIVLPLLAALLLLPALRARSRGRAPPTAAA